MNVWTVFVRVNRSRGSSVSIMTELRARWAGFNYQQEQSYDFFLIATVSRPVLGPTQPPNQWVLGALSPEVKRVGREANRSSPYSAEIKNVWSYTLTPQYVFAWRCLIKQDIHFHFVVLKHGDNFTFTLLLLRMNTGTCRGSFRLPC
jgi:hypothetical protein